MDSSDMASLMSGMSGMGMDSSSGGMFVGQNQYLAHTYWYIIAAIVAFLCLLNVVRTVDVSYRLVLPALLWCLMELRCEKDMLTGL